MSAPRCNDATEDALLAQAEAAYGRLLWREALNAYLDLLRRRLTRRGGFAPTDRVVLERVADLSALFGEDAAADSLLASLVADCARRGLSFAGDYVTLKRAELALAAGRYPEARTLLESLEGRIGPLSDVPGEPAELPAWEDRCCWPGDREPDRALFFSRLYLMLGQWLVGNGQYGHAETLLERGTVLAQPPASPFACRAWVPLRLTLAAALLEYGCLDTCGTVLATLGDRFDSAAHPGWHVEWLGLCGQRRLLLGEFGPAMHRFTEIVDLCTRLGIVRLALTSRLSLARILIFLGRTAAARELLAEAFRPADTDAGTALQIAWLHQLAGARTTSLQATAAASVTELWNGRDGGEGADAAPQTDIDPRELPQSSGFLAFFDDRALAVTWLLGREEITAADDLLAELRETFAHTDSRLIRARMHALAGLVAYAARDYPQSERIFAESCPELEHLGLKPDLLQAFRHRTGCAVHLGRPEPQQRVLQRRVQELTQELADSLPPVERSVWLLSRWRDEELAWSGEIEDLLRERQTGEPARWRQHLHEFLQRVDEARRTLLRRELGDEPHPAAERPASLEDRFSRHPRRTVTLSFLVLPDRVFVARVGWQTLDFTVSRLTRARLRELVAKWHGAVADQLPVPDSVARTLADGLLLPQMLGSLPPDVDCLAIVPDDALHGLPFAALRFDGRCLSDRFALTTVHGARSPGTDGGMQKRGALAVAVSRAIGRNAPLKHAPIEVQAVERLLRAWPIEVHRLGDEADRERVLREWAGAALVHVACHGKFRPDCPGESGLVLIPAPERQEVVSLCDLARLDLRGLRHVTLSSCWGADNFVVPGRWVIGLPETLCRQGAESVLASLWRVDDEVGSAFCQRFYAHARTMRRDQALQATQRACRENRLLDGSTTQDPYYWAGYVLHGSGERLRL